MGRRDARDHSPPKIHSLDSFFLSQVNGSKTSKFDSLTSQNLSTNKKSTAPPSSSLSTTCAAHASRQRRQKSPPMSSSAATSAALTTSTLGSPPPRRIGNPRSPTPSPSPSIPDSRLASATMSSRSDSALLPESISSSSTPEALSPGSSAAPALSLATSRSAPSSILPLLPATLPFPAQPESAALSRRPLSTLPPALALKSASIRLLTETGPSPSVT